jgi:3-phenylpropionate/trans-cinnamate dioxygenase ferredoxin subunit
MEEKMAFVKAAKVGDVPVGRAVTVEVNDEDIALCNVGGEIYAVANVCTHDGGPLGEGHLYGDQIECPRHGARFDVRSGAVKSLPAIVPIDTYQVKVEGDEIMVDVD